MISKLNKIISFSLLVLPTFVMAAAGDILRPGDNPGGWLPTRIFGQQATVGGAILGVLRAGLGLAGLIAVAMLVYGGFRYITSAGNEDIAKDAKRTITNSIIGLIIIILSFVIVTVVTNLAFGTTG
jgi:amino acid transporter